MMQEQWIHEFLTEDPAMLDEVRYLCLPESDEPQLCVSPRAVRAFMHWALRKGYRNRATVEVCQTQPVKMTWCPLRHASWTINNLRGALKREHVGDIHLLGRHDDFPDQAVGNSLAFFKRKPV